MSEDTRGKDSRRRSARDSLKSGLGRLKQVIRTSSHQPEATGSAHGQSSTKNSAWAGLGTSLRALETATKLFSPLKSTIGDLATCLDVIEAAAKTRDDYEELASELKTTIDILNEYVSEFDAEEGRNSVARIVQLIQAQITHINEQREHTNTKRLLESAKDRDDVIRCYRAIEVLFRQLQNEVTLRTWRNTNKQRMMSLLRGMSPVEDARYDSKYSMLVKRGGCTPETRERILEELRNWSRDPTSAMIYWMNGMAGTGKTTIAYSLCSWLEENMLLGASFFCSRISASCRDLSQVLPTIAYQLAHYSSAYRSALCSIIEDDPDVGSRNVTRQFDKLLKEPLSKIGDAIPGVVIVIDALDECQDQNGVRLMLEVLLRLTPSMPLKFFIASRPEPSIRDKMLSSTSSSPSILHLHNIEQSIVEEDIKKYLTEALSSMFPPPCSAQIERLAKQSGKLFIYAATAARYILPDGAYVDSSARLQAMLGVNLESNSTGKHKKKYKELDMLYTTILSAALNQELLEDYELERMKRVLSMIICAKEPLSAMTIASLLQLTEQQVLSTLQPLRSVLHVSEGGEIISALHASFPDYMFDQSRSGIFYFDYRAQSVLIAHRCFDVMERELRFNICQLRSSYVLDRNVPDLQDRVNNFISVSLFYACRYWGQHLQSGNGSDLLRDILLSFLQRRLLFWMEVMNLKGYTGSCQGVILCAQNWILATNGPVELQRQLSDARSFVARFAGSACSQSTPHIYISALPFCPKSSSVYKNHWGHTRGLVEVDGTALRSKAMAPLANWGTISKLNSVGLSADGDRIVCGFGDSTVRVLSVHTGAMIVGPLEGHSGPVVSVAFSFDAMLIASGSVDSTIIIWDAFTGRLITGPIEGHTDSIITLAFSQGAARIISGSADQTISVWNTETGSIINGPFKIHAEPLTSIAISPNGNHIASASIDCTVRVWDLAIGNTSSHILEGHTGGVFSVAFSHDGSRLASGSSDHTVRIWNPYTGEHLAQIPHGPDSWIGSVAFSQDGRRVASGCKTGIIRVWDIETATAIAGPFDLKPYVGAVESIAFSPDGSRLISGYHNNTICVWDAYLGDTAEVLSEHCDMTLLVNHEFSPEGSHLVTASYDGSLCVMDANNGRVITGPLQPHAESPNALSFSPDSAHVAAGFLDGLVCVFNTRTGELVIPPFEAHSDSIYSITFSPDGKHFTTGSLDCTAKIWDACTGEATTEPLEGHIDAILSVQFTPDGAFIATGSRDSTIRVWETNTRRCKHQLSGHESGVNSVTFSPDSTLAASGSDDTTIKLWKIHEEDFAVQTFKDHASEVVLVCFSPDGTQIISSASDGTILVQDTHRGYSRKAPRGTYGCCRNHRNLPQRSPHCL